VGDNTEGFKYSVGGRAFWQHKGVGLYNLFL